MVRIVRAASNWGSRKVLGGDKAPVERWNQVNCTYNLVWVQEPKRRTIITWNKPQADESPCFPTWLRIRVTSKPTNEKEIHLDRLSGFRMRPNMTNVGFAVDLPDSEKGMENR